MGVNSDDYTGTGSTTTAVAGISIDNYRIEASEPDACGSVALDDASA